MCCYLPPRLGELPPMRSQGFGIVADCAYTSPDEIGKHISNENLHLPYRPRRKIIAGIYEHKNQIKGFDYSTVDALESNSVPVLFIHGTHDQFVPVDMTYQNYIACTGGTPAQPQAAADRSRGRAWSELEGTV